MTLTCIGFLERKTPNREDSNYVCQVCSMEFCNRCEAPVISPEHRCNSSDLESVNFINSMVKCPKCLIPVYKFDGCNSMTCSHCGTNFDYSTGNEGGHGGHSNAKITIDMNRDRRLSHDQILTRRLDTPSLDLLLKIETRIPEIVSLQTLIPPLTQYYRDKNRLLAGKILAKRFERYLKSKYALRRYHRGLSRLEAILRKSDSTSTQIWVELDRLYTSL